MGVVSQSFKVATAVNVAPVSHIDHHASVETATLLPLPPSASYVLLCANRSRDRRPTALDGEGPLLLVMPCVLVSSGCPGAGGRHFCVSKANSLSPTPVLCEKLNLTPKHRDAHRALAPQCGHACSPRDAYRRQPQTSIRPAKPICGSCSPPPPLRPGCVASYFSCIT